MIDTILLMASCGLAIFGVLMTLNTKRIQKKVIDALKTEIEQRANYEEYLKNQGVELIRQISFLKNELRDCDRLLGSDRLSEFENMFEN